MRDTSCGQSSLCTAMFTTVLILLAEFPPMTGISSFEPGR